MPDDTLYHTDILAWSRAQAERLRRVAAGERVDDVDWEHVIEEMEEVGRSQLDAVRSFLQLTMLHALKVLAWPAHDAADHWTQAIANFLVEAQERFEPGMEQHSDPVAIYARALRRLRRLPPMRGAPPPLPLPDAVAFTAAELRDPDFGVADLMERMRAAQAPLLPPAP